MGKPQRKRIVFIGRRNVGKSSLVNAFLRSSECTSSLVKEEIKETCEMPMDLPPYGSVIIVDTIPLDAQNEEKQNLQQITENLVSNADFVIVVLDARDKLTQEDKNVFYLLKKLSIPYLAAVNKIEFGINSELINGLRYLNIVHFEISCKENVGIDTLKSRLTRQLQTVFKAVSKK